MKKIILGTIGLSLISTVIVAGPFRKEHANDSQDHNKNKNEKAIQYHEPFFAGKICMYDSEIFTVGAIISDDGITQQCVSRNTSAENNNSESKNIQSETMWKRIQK